MKKQPASAAMDCCNSEGSAQAIDLRSEKRRESTPMDGRGSVCTAACQIRLYFPPASGLGKAPEQPNFNHTMNHGHHEQQKS
jgi:hypothetical protein